MVAMRRAASSWRPNSGLPSEAPRMLEKWTAHEGLRQYVAGLVRQCKPDRVHLCDGSQEEYDHLCETLVREGSFTRLSETLRPNSYLARSDPADVARCEARTFICSPTKDGAGPTNNWIDPAAMRAKLNKLYDGSMRGRTLYAIPFCMGPLGSRLARIGVEVTDSAYVAANMRIMTRMGTRVLDMLGSNGHFAPCTHSVGVPLKPGAIGPRWPCNIDNLYITHFPADYAIASFGSGYGGNALLGKKSLALRIASAMGRNEGWLAEHMLILALINEQTKERIYVAAAFPSACGKTNLAMLQSPLPGWRVETIGDDICWMQFGDDGRLWAVNPEMGFFGVAPGTSYKTNGNAMRTCEANSIFTNVALTPNGDVWWEGIDGKAPPPPGTITWQEQRWRLGLEAAHKNSRFTAMLTRCPCLDPAWDDPRGVPISAILFGGRRDSVIPLVTEAPSWERGVLAGAMISSEATAAAENKGLRHDPFAMTPFCGYHMGDYFAHWLSMAQRAPRGPQLLPKIYTVNWFNKGANGQFLWPGYGENMRVLKWVAERVKGTGKAVSTPIGNVPAPGALDISGLDVSEADMRQITTVDKAKWKAEVAEAHNFFTKKIQRVPQRMLRDLDEIRSKLDS